MKPVTFVSEAIVHAGEGTVRCVVKRTGAKPTRVEPATMEPATMEPATMEPATAVEASTTAMRSVGEVWLGERSNAQHGGCGASQSSSHPGPVAVFG